MKKPFLIILIVCSAVFIAAAVINKNPDMVNRNARQTPKTKPSVTPVQQRTTPASSVSPTPIKSTSTKTSSKRDTPAKPVNRMKFTKHLISLEEVKKHPELHNEKEQLAYWYRYNQSAAGYHHRKPEMAKKNYQRFLSYKPTLGEKRFYAIMNLADRDYPHNR